MKKNLRFDEMELQLFAEGAGGADGGATGSDAAGVTAADAGQQNPGVQEGNAANPGTADAGQQNPNPEADFEGLIKGQYKEQFNARVKKIVDGRVSALHKQVQSYEAGQPVFDILAQKYGVEPTDYAGIAEAIRQDTSLYEKEALECGMDAQDLMKLRNVEADNASMRRQMEMQRKEQQELQRRQQAEEQVSKWNQQAELAKQFYPGLDLQKEITNPDFSRLLSSGVDVRTAFEVIHKDEILQGAMQYAAKRAAKSVTDSVIAGAARPVENGTAAQGAVSAKVDPSKLSEKEFNEYLRRVAGGERITF